MLTDAELGLFTGDQLVEEVTPECTDAVYRPNGVKYDHFQLPISLEYSWNLRLRLT
jgi:hypothetical protein